MALDYKQLAQAREATTNAVSIYSPASGETVLVNLKIANTTASACAVRVFHDIDGVTYDETTALAWDIDIEPGQILEMDKIFMQRAVENLAYRTATGSALTATVYGVVKT